MRSKVALALVLASLIPATPGMSAGRHVYRPEPSPPKDCTKVNGRNGYYGNPWCTEAEQRQWDRYDAARFRIPRVGRSDSFPPRREPSD